MDVGLCTLVDPLFSRHFVHPHSPGCITRTCYVKTRALHLKQAEKKNRKRSNDPPKQLTGWQKISRCGEGDTPKRGSPYPHLEGPTPKRGSPYPQLQGPQKNSEFEICSQKIPNPNIEPPRSAQKKPTQKCFQKKPNLPKNPRFFHQPPPPRSLPKKPQTLPKRPQTLPPPPFPPPKSPSTQKC